MIQAELNLWPFVIMLSIIFGVIILLYGDRKSKPRPGEVANTFKFRTAIFLGLALVTKGVIVTIPLFLYLAYQSYASGFPKAVVAALPTKAEQLSQLHSLLDSGALNRTEYEVEKQKLLRS